MLKKSLMQNQIDFLVYPNEVYLLGKEQDICMETDKFCDLVSRLEKHRYYQYVRQDISEHFEFVSLRRQNEDK